jgi:PAS domain-containing protein
MVALGASRQYSRPSFTVATFNQNLIMTMIDHMTQGVSVVDENMCLVAWNNQYLKLFDYPKDLVYVGCPISDLIRYNANGRMWPRFGRRTCP